MTLRWLLIGCLVTIVVMAFTMSGYGDSATFGAGGKTVGRLLTDTSEQLRDKYGLKPSGMIIAMPGGVLRRVGLEFHVCGPRTKAELRGLLLSILSEILNAVNGSEQVHGYMVRYPFGVENIEINLFILDSQGNRLDDPDIGIASIYKGNLEYQTLLSGEVRSVKTQSIESYDDAVRTRELDGLH
jgi:hypothetical protein